jgi:hypothetical protein
MIGGVSWVLDAVSLQCDSATLTPALGGRAFAMALYQTATFGGMALGSPGSGADSPRKATAFQFRTFKPPLYALLAGAAIGFFFPMAPAMKALNLDPLNQWEHPNLALDLQSVKRSDLHRRRVGNQRGRPSRFHAPRWTPAAA